MYHDVITLARTRKHRFAHVLQEDDFQGLAMHVFFAHRRARRAHAQATRVFAPCLADADAGLNLRQRPEGRAFEFLASRDLARELLQLSTAQIKVSELQHTRDKAAAVLARPAGPSEALWPVKAPRPAATARHLASPAAAMLDMLEKDGDAPRLARPRQAAFAGMAAERTVPCDPQSPWPDLRVEAVYSPSFEG